MDKIEKRGGENYLNEKVFFFPYNKILGAPFEIRWGEYFRKYVEVKAYEEKKTVVERKY